MKKHETKPSAELRRRIKELDGVWSIRLRAEGDVNRMWEFRLTGGENGESIVVGMYAYEGSAQYDYDDGSVWDDDRELDEFLEELFDRVSPYYPDNFDEGADVAEFELFTRAGVLNLTTVEHHVQTNVNV